MKVQMGDLEIKWSKTIEDFAHKIEMVAQRVFEKTGKKATPEMCIDFISTHIISKYNSKAQNEEYNNWINYFNEKIKE
jgi:hypothetical protein